MSPFTIACVGDIYANSTVRAAREDPSRVAVVAAALGRADLRFGNLEAPLLAGGTPRFSTGVRLQSPPETTGFLRHLGFDVLGIANNHILDLGPEGLRSTRQLLDEARIPAVGAGPTAAVARAPAILTARGNRVGFLAACDNWGDWASRTRPGVFTANPRRLVAAVRALCAEVDYVVVSVHTGIEFSGLPEPFFRALARRLVDAGATLVVGHHPHAPQGIERYGRGLIAYSLGNFLFDHQYESTWMTETQWLMLKTRPVLEVAFDGGGVAGHEVRWFVQDAEGTYEPAAGDHLEAIEREFQGLCEALRGPDAYRRQVQSVYREELKGLLYYTPAHFLRRIRREGPRQLVPFFWWLGLFCTQPARRRICSGFVRNGAWLWARRLGARLS